MLLSLKTFLVSLGHVEKVRVWSGGSDESRRSMGEWWYMGHVVKKKKQVFIASTMLTCLFLLKGSCTKTFSIG